MMNYSILLYHQFLSFYRALMLFHDLTIHGQVNRTLLCSIICCIRALHNFKTDTKEGANLADLQNLKSGWRVVALDLNNEETYSSYCAPQIYLGRAVRMVLSHTLEWVTYYTSSVPKNWQLLRSIFSEYVQIGLTKRLRTLTLHLQN